MEAAEIDALLEEENEQEKEQLKLHLLDTINDICKEEAKMIGKPISKALVDGLSSVAYDFVENMAADVEHFAQHAKRSVVNVDDVLLCTRRNPSIQALLLQHMEKNNIQRPSRGRRGSKKTVSNK